MTDGEACGEGAGDGGDRWAPGFWGMLAGQIIHPTQLLILEAMRWIAEPVSSSQLAKVLGGDLSIQLVSYHCHRLDGTDRERRRSGSQCGSVFPPPLKFAYDRPVRGAVETFYVLHPSVLSRKPPDDDAASEQTAG